jgi:hypothetical protein
MYRDFVVVLDVSSPWLREIVVGRGVESEARGFFTDPRALTLRNKSVSNANLARPEAIGT